MVHCTIGRPKHAICPHKQDYCDTCAGEISAKQTTINRLRQAAATEPEKLKQLEEEVKLLFSQTCNKSDVFNTGELRELISQYADVFVDNGEIVRDWKSKLSKYSNLQTFAASTTLCS